MERLLIIHDTDVGSDTPDPAKYRERVAARAVVFDQDNNVALLHATVLNYHKLPGGGIDEGEDVIAALKRECLEEIGCKIENIVELGSIEEFRNKISLHQWSHCYTARVVGEKGTPHLEEDEVAEGFETVWMPLTDAIKTLESELNSDVYLARFMTRRDLTFLKAAHESNTTH